MRPLYLRLVATVVCAILALGGSSAAQEVATIQATATVVSGLTVVGANNLQFGTVTPGVPTTVDKAAVTSAGRWDISGTAGSEISVTFTLPLILDNTSSPTSMPISFSATDASYNDGTGSQSSPTGVLDPAAPQTLRLGTVGLLEIFIGGTVSPTISQGGGDYTADVTITVAYTGN